jgi:flagellar protein FliJ
MTANQIERMRRSNEFTLNQRRRHVNQIEIMIAEFDRVCIDLGHQIAVAETQSRIYDPMNFAYPTFAKAIRERRAKLQRSADALGIELRKLTFEANEAPNRQVAA